MNYLLNTACPNRSNGFTLVEVITVVVILGIIATLGTGFIVNTMDAYKVAETRGKLVQRGRLTLEQMAREIRMSVPNSHRVSPSNRCLEFLPIVAATRYRSNIATSENNASAKNFINTMSFSLGRGSAQFALISSYSPTEVYSGSNPGVRATISSVGVEPITRVDFSANHRFLRESVIRRLYIADSPIRFCVLNGVLQRVSQYGISAAALTDTLPGGTVDIMAHDVDPNGNAFSLSPGSADRNALVNINLLFSQTSTSIDLSHQVLIRNGP